MLTPYKIKWQNLSSLEFDVWTELAFDEDTRDVDSQLGRTPVISEVYNGTLKRVHSYKWNNSFTPTITFIKQDYSDFTPEENRKMLKWLTGSKNPSFLEIYKDDSEAAEYYILGNWIEVSQHKLGNGRVVGYVAKFESVAPWAFSDIQSVTKDVSSPKNNTIQLFVETDEPEDLIYPRITIEQNESTHIIEINYTIQTSDMLAGTVYKNGDTYYWLNDNRERQTGTTPPPAITTTSITIKNTDENGKKIVSTISDNVKGEKITIDGANRVISSTRPDRIFGDNFNWNWIGFTEGENTLSVVGNCTVTVEWREPIKCGEF